MLVSINCTKAIPVQGYNMMCEMLEPFKSKLHQKSRQAASRAQTIVADLHSQGRPQSQTLNSYNRLRHKSA